MKIRNRHGHFNLIAPFYDRVFGSMRHKLLLQHLDAQADDILLDIGGGTGRVAQHLAASGVKTIVVDPSPVMLQATREKRLQGVRALAEQLPFPSASIQRILIVDAFHHFANQELAAKELMRVLKPGGRLVIEEPDLRTTGTKIIAILEKVALMQTHFITPPDMADLFGAYGAKLITIDTENINAQIVLTK
jgi:demethylmenaquinone methyltransferase/2-methoxy-6-polyprenyl-1,4-benzoquinol methylase